VTNIFGAAREKDNKRGLHPQKRSKPKILPLESYGHHLFSVYKDPNNKGQHNLEKYNLKEEATMWDMPVQY